MHVLYPSTGIFCDESLGEHLGGQCILFSVVVTPPPPTHHGSTVFGSYLSSLYCNLHCIAGAGLPIHMIGEVSWEAKTRHAWASQYLIPRWVPVRLYWRVTPHSSRRLGRFISCFIWKQILKGPVTYLKSENTNRRTTRQLISKVTKLCLRFLIPSLTLFLCLCLFDFSRAVP
jgi:hypothetical protein